MKVYQNTAISMGTRFSLLLPGMSEYVGKGFFNECIQELNRLENMLSYYIASSEISFLNNKAAEGPVNVSDELFSILDLCLHYNTRTLKTFDIGLGNLIENTTDGCTDERFAAAIKKG